MMSPCPVDTSSMDRRREPRFETSKPVRVTLLGDDEVSLEGRMVEISGCGMRLMLEEPLPVSAAVRVDYNDTLLLGEVCHATRQGESYTVGLALDQVLYELTRLSKLAEALPDHSPASVTGKDSLTVTDA